MPFSKRVTFLKDSNSPHSQKSNYVQATYNMWKPVIKYELNVSETDTTSGYFHVSRQLLFSVNLSLV